MKFQDKRPAMNCHKLINITTTSNVKTFKYEKERTYVKHKDIVSQ